VPLASNPIEGMVGCEASSYTHGQAGSSQGGLQGG